MSFSSCVSSWQPSGVPFNPIKQRPSTKKTHRLKFQHLRLLKFPKNLDSCENMWKYWKKTTKYKQKSATVTYGISDVSCHFWWICGKMGESTIRSDDPIRFFGEHFLGKSAALMSPNASPLEICMERCSFDLGWIFIPYIQIYPDISSGQIKIIPNRIKIIPNRIKNIPNQIKIIPNQIEIIPNQMCVSLNGGTPQSPPQVLIIFSRKPILVFGETHQFRKFPAWNMLPFRYGLQSSCVVDYSYAGAGFFGPPGRGRCFGGKWLSHSGWNRGCLRCGYMLIFCF